MGLAVIVTAYRSPETLRACVQRLQQDPAVTQILVADCSETPPALPVPVTHFPTPTPVPAMRWAMVNTVTEPIVACLEGRCVPVDGWGTALLNAHAAHPDATGIGGAVDIDAAVAWLDRVVWFCEYAAFAPPQPDAPATDLSGAHLSYKTAALRAENDLLNNGAWETQLHLRWCAAGRQLRTANAPRIVFRNGMTAAGFLRQRLQYGRGYASARCRTNRRWLLGLMTPALPFLLTARTGMAAQRAGRLVAFLTCLPGVFFYHAVWGAGELLGYWFGASAQEHIY